MTSSLTVLLASIGFLIFGYLSVLRIIYKQHFSALGSRQMFAELNVKTLGLGLGQSALFISLPATSLLLFWGWGAALLWLVVFHLLVETLINFQLSIGKTSLFKDPAEVRDNALATELIRYSWQLYLIVLMAIVLTLLSDLIDKQSGLLFALGALIPVHALLRKQNTILPRLFYTFSALAVFVLGLLFADQLGISVYGSFNPLTMIESLSNTRHLDWLSFNNTTLIALLLLVGAASLSGNSSFRQDLTRFTTVLIALVFVMLLVVLAWLNPALDAPLNSAQERAAELPWFGSLCLLLFAGLSSLLLRTDFAKTDSSEPESRFVLLQSISLLHLVFVLILMLGLATAVGIGAWNTHYVDWQGNSDLITHFNLMISNNLKLLDSSSRFGVPSYTLFMSGLAFVGFALLIQLMHRLRWFSYEPDEDDSLIENLIDSNIPHAIAVYFLSCFLISKGITIDLWLMIGMLAWLLVCNAVLENTISYKEQNVVQHLQGGLCAALVAIGAIQVLWTGVLWVLAGNWFFATVTVLILLLSVLLWHRRVVILVKRFRSIQAESLFDKQ